MRLITGIDLRGLSHIDSGCTLSATERLLTPAQIFPVIHSGWNETYRIIPLASQVLADKVLIGGLKGRQTPQRHDADFALFSPDFGLTIYDAFLTVS